MNVKVEGEGVSVRSHLMLYMSKYLHAYIYLHIFEGILFTSECQCEEVSNKVPAVCLHVCTHCLLSTYELTLQCVSVTFSLGGHFERCWALALPVAVVWHHPEAIFSVWHQILDGDLHLSWSASVHHSLPDLEREKNYWDFNEINKKKKTKNVYLIHFFIFEMKLINLLIMMLFYNNNINVWGKKIQASVLPQYNNPRQHCIFCYPSK